MERTERSNAVAFISKGILFVAASTFIGTIGHFFIPGTTGDLVFVDQLRVSGIAALYAFCFAIIPAAAGYFLLRMIRKMPKSSFIMWAAVLGLFLGLATLALAPPAYVFISSLFSKHSFSQWASLLAFPVIPLIASIVFFVLLGLKHVKTN